MTRRMGFVAMSAVAVLLAGCGSNGENSDVAEPDTNSAVAGDSGWNAADACTLLDKAAVGAALGDSVTETSLALVNQASGSSAATSECTYRLAGGGTAMLMARRSPIGDNTEEAIATTRNATAQSMAAFSDKKIEDIAGLGKAAFFVPGINQLNVFIDDERFIILTLGTAPADTAKATATQLAKTIAK